MATGGKDAESGAESPRPVDAAPTEPKDLPQNEELAQKYSAPKAFDWSRVRGAGKGGRSRAEKRKKEKVEEEAAPEESAVAEVLKRVPMTRKEMYIAGGVSVFILGLLYFAFLRGDPGLGESLSVSEQQRFEQQAQKEMADRLATLEKTYGADHPEVLQEREMMRQLKAQANK